MEKWRQTQLACVEAEGITTENESVVTVNEI
jgi:hypothetical protein